MEHSLDARQYPPLARMVVAHTLKKKLNSTPVTDPDFDDMLQVAWIAIWKHQDKPQAYQFVAARSAVLHYFFHTLLGRKRGKTSCTSPPSVWESCLSLDRLADGKGERTISADPPNQPLDLAPLDDDALILLLASTYSSFGTKLHYRSINAAKTDMAIIELLQQGYNTNGIAHELNRTTNTIYCRRKRIRTALQEILDDA